MANFNKVILMGNLTRDPELRETPGGTKVCKFGLATNRVYRTQAGEQRKDVCFVDIVVWGRQGENCAQYLSKGRRALIEGRLEYDAWEAPDGTKRSKLRVVADSVQFLGGPGGGNGGDGSYGSGSHGSGGYGEDRADYGAQNRAPAPASAPAAPANRPPAPEEYDLDDVPF